MSDSADIRYFTGLRTQDEAEASEVALAIDQLSRAK